MLAPRGDLSGGGGADVDVYSFFSDVGHVTAELWSIDRFGSDFDGITDRFVDVGDRVTAMPRVEIMELMDSFRQSWNMKYPWE